MTHEGGVFPLPRNKILVETKFSNIVHNWNHQKFDYIYCESMAIDLGT